MQTIWGKCAWNKLRGVFLHWRCYRGFYLLPKHLWLQKYCKLTTMIYYFRHLTWMNLVPITADYFVVWFYFNIRSRRFEVFPFFFNIAPWQLTNPGIYLIYLSTVVWKLLTPFVLGTVNLSFLDIFVYPFHVDCLFQLWWSPLKNSN